MGQKLAAHFGIPVRLLAERLDNHMIRVDLTYPERLSPDGKVRFDWWGAGFDTGEEGYFPRVMPLAENRDLDRFTWPDPHAVGLLDGARDAIAADCGEHFIIPNFGFALFERAWSLRGFDAFLMDLALDPGYAGELLDRITEIQLGLIGRFLDLGVDGGYFGDDYGAQQNMLFSPATWRTLIKPRLARLFAPFRVRGLPVLMHTDGQVQKILPDLVEIGLTTLNPVQPEVVEHAWLRATFGQSLSYYGGVSTQTVLPYGTPGEVRAAVQAAAKELAPDGTGLIIAPSHRMMTDIPVENVLAMLDAFQKL
jgi:uroporphyrinogen decarboxylase